MSYLEPNLHLEHNPGPEPLVHQGCDLEPLDHRHLELFNRGQWHLAHNHRDQVRLVPCNRGQGRLRNNPDQGHPRHNHVRLLHNNNKLKDHPLLLVPEAQGQD